MYETKANGRHDGLILLDQLVGSLITGVRRRYKLSPEELSKLIGSSAEEVLRWEAGEQPVDLPMLWLIAETIGFSAEYFTNGLSFSVEANQWNLEPRNVQ